MKEKETSELKPVKLRLEIDFASHHTRAEGLVNADNLHLNNFPESTKSAPKNQD